MLFFALYVGRSVFITGALPPFTVTISTQNMLGLVRRSVTLTNRAFPLYSYSTA